MSEATLTAAIQGQALQPGAVVLAELGGGPPQLAMVTDLPGNDVAQIITVTCPGSDELITRIVTRSTLLPSPRDLDAGQQQLTRRLMIWLAADAWDRTEQMREEASAAHQKIDSMRSYAIEKHLDGTICREGLNDFLAAHDLDIYQPRHRAQVTVRLDVEVNGADGEFEAAQMIRNCVEVSSNDEDDVWITTEPDLTVSGVQSLPAD